MTTERRKYSIDEIDAMRSAIRNTISMTGGNYRESERAAHVEDVLRTHMMNGTDLEELQQGYRAARDAYFKDQEARQEHYREVQKRHSEKYPERPRPEGVMDCLSVVDNRADAFRSGGSRCANCREMQLSDAFTVWVPDSVRMGERAVSIRNAAEANKYNGSLSGWCLDCARRLTRKAGN